MKITINEAVMIYRTLGVAKASTLDDHSFMSILRARKTLRPIAEEFDAYLKDAREKMRKDAESDESFNVRLNKALNEELIREIEVELPTLPEGVAIKILKENGWQIDTLDGLRPMLE